MDSNYALKDILDDLQKYKITPNRQVANKDDVKMSQQDFRFVIKKDVKMSIQDSRRDQPSFVVGSLLDVNIRNKQNVMMWEHARVEQVDAKRGKMMVSLIDDEVRENYWQPSHFWINYNDLHQTQSFGAMKK